MPFHGPELLLVLAVLILLFGATRIPKLARSLGQASREFRQGVDTPAPPSTTDAA